MKVKIINKDGLTLTFKSVKDAKPHILNKERKDYDTVDGVRVYDSRLYYRDIPVKFSRESYAAFNL